MTTEPPAGSAWPPPAGGHPPQPPGGRPPPQPGPGGVRLPDPPAASGFDGQLPEPPPSPWMNLQWGDPTPAPAPPPRQGPPPPPNKIAIAAAALGALVGGAGLALIAGLVALVQIRKSGERGKGLALAGIALTAVWAVAIGVLYVTVLSQPPLRDADGAITRKGDVAVDKLQVGDCIEKWATSQEVGRVTAIPCGQAHDAEVFHVFDLSGDKYPGTDEVTEQANTQCSDQSTKAIKEADLKNAKVAVLRPIEASWNDGARQVTCIAVQNGGTITRSIRS